MFNRRRNKEEHYVAVVDKLKKKSHQICKNIIEKKNV